MDRLQEIMMAAENVTFSKNQSSALVGGRRRLERLAAEKKIAFVKTTNKRMADGNVKVLMYCVMPYPKITLAYE